MDDEHTVFGFVFSLVALAILLGVGWAWESYSCSSKADVMGMQSRWGLSTGCMVKTPKGWFSIEQVRDEQ